MSKDYFPKVKEARDALTSKALDLYQEYYDTIQAAKAAGEWEVALEHFKFLILHMPKQDGVAMVDASPDKSHAKGSGHTLPTIQIGFKLGGLPDSKPLPPAEVIDVTPDKK